MSSFYDRQASRKFIPLALQTASTSFQKAISLLLQPVSADGTRSCQYLLSIPGIPNIYKGGHSRNVPEAQNQTYNKCNYETRSFFATKPSLHPTRVEGIRHLLSHQWRRREKICNAGLGCGSGGHIEFYGFVSKKALEEHMRIAFALVRFMESAPYVPRRAGKREDAGKVGDLVLSEFWLVMYGKCQPNDVAGLLDMLEEGLGTDRATLKWEAFEVERLGRAFDQNRGIQEMRAKSEGVGSCHHGSYGLPEGSRFTKSLSPPTQSLDLPGDPSQDVKPSIKSQSTGALWQPPPPHIKVDYDRERKPKVKPEPMEDLWESTPFEYQALDEEMKPVLKRESTKEEWEATPFQYQDLSGNKIGPEPEISLATKSEWENSRMMVKEQFGRRLSQIPQYEGGEGDVMEGLLSPKDEEMVAKAKFEEDPERKLLDIPRAGQTHLKMEHGDGIAELEGQWHDRIKSRISTRERIRIRRFKWLSKLRSLTSWFFREKTKARYRRRFLQDCRSGMLAKSSRLLRTTVISRSRKGGWRYVIGQRVKKRV